MKPAMNECVKSLAALNRCAIATAIKVRPTDQTIQPFNESTI
jgi:hypothetical protein